jgi:hypothetical protein
MIKSRTAVSVPALLAIVHSDRRRHSGLRGRETVFRDDYCLPNKGDDLHLPELSFPMDAARPISTTIDCRLEVAPCEPDRFTAP